jgi:hypothetical protein
MPQPHAREAEQMPNAAVGRLAPEECLGLRLEFGMAPGLQQRQQADMMRGGSAHCRVRL